MRPIYETTGDLHNEKAVGGLLCRKWQCEIAKMPRSYHVDYVAYQGSTLKAWLEIKCRNNPMDQYSTYSISMMKVMNGARLAEFTGLPFLVVVRWTDVVGYINPVESDHGLQIGGRKDRGDWQDTEAMCHFDISRFQLLANVPPSS